MDPTRIEADVAIWELSAETNYLPAALTAAIVLSKRLLRGKRGDDFLEARVAAQLIPIRMEP
jgi:hypothetical protein